MKFHTLPPVSKSVRLLRNALVGCGLLRRKYEDQFTGIYEKRYWGAAGSASGGGSSLESTRIVREVLPRLFREKAISSLLDIPCGDFYWMDSVPLGGISYIGGDIVAPLIVENERRHARPGVRFIHLDVINDPLPRADLVICRDCLVHLPLADVVKALRNIARSGSKLLLTTSFPSRVENKEIAAGKWRPLNLQIAPFHLPKPDELINEECHDAEGAYADKSLGLWTCEAIRRAVG
jgi:hypothetical protein